MLKMISVLLLLVIVFAFTVQIMAVSKEDRVLNWYCPKIVENRQPIADAPMRIIDEYHGYYLDKRHGNDCADKVVYLTFDAGYENGNVEKILDILKEENVSGAFFILGNLIQRNPDLVRRMADEGNLVCNHTNHHKDMTKFDTVEEFGKELSSLEELYYQSTGKEMSKYYRPPEGKFDERSLQFASSLGYKTIFWSLAYADWDNQNQPSAEYAKEKILSRIHNGAVILLHPTSKTNALILKDVIQSLKKMGYRFGTLDELTSESL